MLSRSCQALCAASNSKWHSHGDVGIPIAGTRLCSPRHDAWNEAGFAQDGVQRAALVATNEKGGQCIHQVVLGFRTRMALRMDVEGRAGRYEPFALLADARRQFEFERYFHWTATRIAEAATACLDLL